MDFVCEVLADGHDASGLDSGRPSLDDWLRMSARDSDGRNLTRTYVWHRGDRITVAYNALMPYFIERETLNKKQARRLPDRISCYLMARLALHRDLHGNRLGSQLLASALARAAVGSRDLGGRYVVVDAIDAIDDAAASFYRHHGFEPVPTMEHRLVLATKALDVYLVSLLTGHSRHGSPADLLGLQTG